MIEQSTFDFLVELRENNHKDWFDANRKRYERARNNFLTVVQEVIDHLEEIDDSIAEARLEPKKSIMRINRDIRFSKDKTPYKTNFFTSLTPAGKKGPHAGYYLCVEPGGSFYGGGIYMPHNKVLNPVREVIEENVGEWEQIVGGEMIDRFGELRTNKTLTRPPKGFEKDSPALEWIKRTDYYVMKHVDDNVVAHEDFISNMAADFSTMEPFVAFINRAMPPLLSHA